MSLQSTKIEKDNFPWYVSFLNDSFSIIKKEMLISKQA